jgi:hypothetical protein
MKLLYYSILLFGMRNNNHIRLLFTPKNGTYNKSIPTPKSILNFELGEMHADHTQVALYMKEAKASNRILIETTYFENRPCNYYYFKSKPC